MITLFSGTPGSGKSLHIAQKILNWTRNGKFYVICNFEVNLDFLNYPENFFYVPNWELTPDLLIDYSVQYFETHKYKESSLLLIIDECQLLFNAREWSVKGRDRWVYFFTQHRKLGYDIFLVAQFDRMIDRQLRSLIEYEIIHRKVSNFGIRGKLLSIWSGNRLFFAIKYWYPLRERLGNEIFHYSKKLGELYDTCAIFDSKKDSSKIISVSHKDFSDNEVYYTASNNGIKEEVSVPVQSESDDVELEIINL